MVVLQTVTSDRYKVDELSKKGNPDRISRIH